MSLKYLSYQELDLKIKSLAAREKQLLHEILLTIQEIDARKMYLDFGYSNLFSYLTTGVGYSEGAAQRRIDAARLLSEIPEIGAKIQTGEIQLNQISLLQKTVRLVMKTQKQKVNTTQKKEILQQLTHLNHNQSQQKISEFFDLPILTEVKRQTQADASVRLEMTLSKELFQKIEHAQQLLSHQIPTGDLVQYLEYVTDQVIKHYTSTKVEKSKTSPNLSLPGHHSININNPASAANINNCNSSKIDMANITTIGTNRVGTNRTGSNNVCNTRIAATANQVFPPSNPPYEREEITKTNTLNLFKDESKNVTTGASVSTAIVAVSTSQRASVKSNAVPTTLLATKPEARPLASQISAVDRRRLLAQQKCCQFVDPRTGKKCQSRWFLQVDHRQPRWAEGSNQFENLQILCSAHNRYKYRQEASTKFISK